MKDEIIQLKSISQLHELCSFEKPKHPLVSIIDVSQWEIPEAYVGLKTVSSLYSIGLKDGSCGLQYGRNTYDFDEGVLFFAAPNQVQSITKAQKKNEVNGWMLFFHPDLIRNTALGQIIDSYHFFSYDVHEALHLSDAEQRTITDCVNLIKNEISERIDSHSQAVISSTIELLLKLSQRYYERQFNTRSAQNSDVVSQFHALLKGYFEKGMLREKGIPSVEYFAEKVHLSSNYFSDVLKKETGLNAKDQINEFVIDKAKTMLLGKTDSISGIAYELGFNYPHYFGRLFKKKTGMTPLEYRQQN
jgi:AraC-like DNA-binding protein